MEKTEMNLDTIWCDDSRTFPLSDRNVNSNYAIKKKPHYKGEIQRIPEKENDKAKLWIWRKIGSEWWN